MIAARALAQGKHFRMDDAAPGGHPLQIPLAKAGASAHGIGMIDKAMAGHGYRFEAAMGMLGKARHPVAVIHAPTIPAAEVLADGAPGEGRGRGHVIIAVRVGIVVVGAKEKRVQGWPMAAQWRDIQQTGFVHPCLHCLAVPQSMPELGQQRHCPWGYNFWALK